MVARNIVHFDVQADDVDRARMFYARVFGWRFSAWGPPGFFIIATGDDADPGIHGAVHERPAQGHRSIGFECTIAVDDVDEIADLVQKEGGEITVPKMTIPEVGELIQFKDTEGNIACAMRYFSATHSSRPSKPSPEKPARLDHIILNVNDRAKSVEFYTRIMGFAYEGERPGTPFSVIKVSPDFMLQLSPFGTKGGEHLAFSMSREEFEQTFQRVRDAGIEYGDAFNKVGNLQGPAASDGASGTWTAVYFFDPDRHLIEIAYY